MLSCDVSSMLYAIATSSFSNPCVRSKLTDSLLYERVANVVNSSLVHTSGVVFGTCCSHVSVQLIHPSHASLPSTNQSPHSTGHRVSSGVTVNVTDDGATAHSPILKTKVVSSGDDAIDPLTAHCVISIVPFSNVTVPKSSTSLHSSSVNV